MADGFRKSCSYCCIVVFSKMWSWVATPKGVNVTAASICRHAMSSCVGMYDVSKVSQCFRSLPGDLPEMYVVGEETCRHKHRSQEVSTKCKLSTKFEHPVSQVILFLLLQGQCFKNPHVTPDIWPKSHPLIPPIFGARRPRRKRNLNQPIQKSRPESVCRARTVGIPGEKEGKPCRRDQNVVRWLGG